MPGGGGGGGEWKGIVGIKKGASKHPLYVEFGTGIYAGKGLIYPRASMSADGVQEAWRRSKARYCPLRWTQGSARQHYFYRTWRVLNAHMSARIAREETPHRPSKESRNNANTYQSTKLLHVEVRRSGRTQR